MFPFHSFLIRSSVKIFLDKIFFFSKPLSERYLLSSYLLLEEPSLFVKGSFRLFKKKRRPRRLKESCVRLVKIPFLSYLQVLLRVKQQSIVAAQENTVI